MLPGRGMSRDIQMQLYESRLRLKLEMQAALRCTKKDQKIRLVDRWKREYPPVVWEELLRVARKPEVARVIADWYLEKPDT